MQMNTFGGSAQVLIQSSRVVTHREWVQVREISNVCCSVFLTDNIKFNSFPVVHFEI